MVHKEAIERDDKEMTIGRRAKIIELLDTQGHVGVTDLSRRFRVSEVTIRNDLGLLEERGILIRARGGAIRNQRVNIDYHLSEKSKRHLAEKQAIGKKTVELITEEDTIILDSGTTTLEVAKNLSGFTNLTIITNALNVAGQLVNYPQIKLIMLGGMLRQSSLSMLGPVAEANIRDYYCDKLIMGVDSIDSRYGISTPTIEEAHLNRLMIDIAKEVIVVTDSSKFLRRSFAFIAPISDVDVVVTDANIPDEERKNLESLGIKTIVV
ncbi:MAG: DeoR/GlpR transcriptional regulator [Bacteroidetes bacterium]|nr:DeoR/GlpR transcriptional regulator [Bacteroidota bacterium]